MVRIVRSSRIKGRDDAASLDCQVSFVGRRVVSTTGTILVETTTTGSQSSLSEGRLFFADPFVVNCMMIRERHTAGHERSDVTSV